MQRMGRLSPLKVTRLGTPAHLIDELRISSKEKTTADLQLNKLTLQLVARRSEFVSMRGFSFERRSIFI
jgi:hypothetical protein